MERRSRISREEEERQAQAWLAQHADQLGDDIPTDDMEIASGDALDVGDHDAANERQAQIDAEIAGEGLLG